MADIVISEFMDEAAIREGLAGYDVLYDPGLVDRPDELAAEMASARAIIVRNRTQVRGALLDGARSLRAVGRLGVGLDNIDVGACKARNIAVLPATGANDLSVAEYVICTAMLLLRGAYHATPEMLTGAWPRNALIGRETAARVMGLIGFGSIARETAKRAAALGMRVVAYDPYAPDSAFSSMAVERRELETLLAEADVVSLHVPLTADTRGLIGADAIGRMRPGAVVINAARGGVVDEIALAEALRAGRLGGAALDVFAEEPLGRDAAAKFANVPNLVLTPHIAGVTEESNVRVSWVTVENVRKVLSA
ncbi:hydroxyacid dehydrogenase [Methylobacterium nigriterrae]|uniref:hydroxyacid dehydrogenase n=1 Tax=Methylobacterium nigriterrae TaxID=3127512 RepID=UPI0030138A4D